jgi:hypothetical protein
MDKRSERQFEAADAAVDQAVTAFIGKIESMLGKWEAVAPAYVIERLALTLCTQLSKLVDDPCYRNTAGPAALNLSNALADYRDSRWVER